MTLEITGKLVKKYDTQQVTQTFTKKEFVLELSDEINGKTYTNYAKMQLTQAKCDLIDKFSIGDNIKVSFNIKGSRYEKDGKESYFTNLEAWRIESAGGKATPTPTDNYRQPEQQWMKGDDVDSELPF